MDLSQDILSHLISYKVYMEKNDLQSALRAIRDLISVAQDQEHYVQEARWEEMEAEAYEKEFVSVDSTQRIPNEP